MAQNFEPYIIPNFEPYIGEDFKGTWIEIKSYEIAQQTAFAANGKGGIVTTGYEGPWWKFLAPQQIMETINNEWAPWETISSRLAGKGKEFLQMGKELQGIGSALSAFKGGISMQALGSAYKNLSSVSKTKSKVDTPLVYENTERREWTMEFNLIADTEDHSKTMMRAVKTIEGMSLPIRTEAYEGLGIDLPFIFSIKSPPSNALIYTEFAALTSVQPTLKSPYDKDGYPMMIDLSLTFKELPPLYGNFKWGPLADGGGGEDYM